MSRYLRIIVCCIALSSIVSSCQSDTKSVTNSEPIWDDALIVAYANIDQLHRKSDIANLDISHLLKQDLEELSPSDKSKVELVREIISNPHASGIAIDKPVYMVVRELQSVMATPYVTLAAEISDITKFDATIKLLGEDAEAAELSFEGERRIIVVDQDVIIGYDSKRFMMLICKDSSCNHRQLLNTLLDYAPADLSRLEGYDMAIYNNLNKSIEKALYETASPDTEELSQKYQEYVEAGANIICGLTFEDGTISLISDVEGIKESELATLKTANNKHLNLLPPAPIALLNMSINGEATAEVIDALIDMYVAANGNQALSNELNIAKGIALGVIGSIDGDVTLALSEANGKLIEDEISGSRLVFTTANATLAADVKDDYIIKNINTYGGSFLRKSGKDSYTAEMFGNKINIGQRDKLFYLGINNNADAKSRSAANEEWSNDINGSYIYAMVDFNKLFSSSFGRAALSGFYANSSKSETQNMKLVVNNIERAYFLVNGNHHKLHGELTVTLRNHSTNSLKQLAEIVYNQSK